MPKKKDKRKARRVASARDCGRRDESLDERSLTPQAAGPVNIVTQHIAGTNIQIGDGNIIKGSSRYESDSSYSENNQECSSSHGQSVGNKHKTLESSEDHRKTYAEAVTGKKVFQQINAEVVNINIGSDSRSITKEKPAAQTKSEISSFHKYVDKFSRGHYILVVGELDSLQYVDTLARIPWTAVFDFDPNSRLKGLLSRVEHLINKCRSLHIESIKDPHTFSEQVTNWIYLMGCAERADTRTAADPGGWKKEIEEEIYSLITKLKQFEAGVTHFTFFVLWPHEARIANCIQHLLGRVCSRMTSSVLLVDNGDDKSDDSELYFKLLQKEEEVNAVTISLKDMCTEIGKILKPIRVDPAKYRLPTKDQSNNPGISEETAQWLKEDLEVLYLDNTSGVEYSVQQLKEEEDNFHKGGTLPWEWWYQIDTGHADIKRDLMDSIVESIETNHFTKATCKVITLMHPPGSGGTTLAQQVLWKVRNKMPSVQMKHNSESPVTDLIEKLTLIYDRTESPLLLLLDGEDEHRVHSLQRLAQQFKICAVMLHVKRFVNDMELRDQESGVFVLQDKISKREATHLQLKLDRNRSDHEKRRRNVERLLKAVENDEPRSIFEFGLAAHSYEYTGIESYVREYLQLSSNENCKEDILPWQKALAYLSLVYFYGHTSLPCHFFTEMLGAGEGKSRILDIGDFPKQMQEFIVRNTNECRLHTVRISHFYIAKEILEQLLPTSRIERSISPYLCREARKLLGTFSKGFIDMAGKVNDGNSSEVISKMLINTFIKRNKTVIQEDETQERRLKGPKPSQFSHLLEDASSSAPYTERFNILNQLVISFPTEAQFRAHLGRLYMICRPEEIEKAEENLKKAYEMSSAILKDTQSIDDIPYTKRLDLRNICHMYGNMLSNKVFKYTGKRCTDRPLLMVEKEQFSSKAKHILKDVLTACRLFSLNREVTYPGYEDCLGFIGEIHLRLMFCRFVKDMSGSVDLEVYARNNTGEVAEFVNDCYVKLGELFDDVCQINDPKYVAVGDQPLHELNIEIMGTQSSGHIVLKMDETTPLARRRFIDKLIRKYSTKTKHAFLENVQNENDIKVIVECYEQNFKTASPTDTDLGRDYRGWIRAIRLEKCTPRYTIEKVFAHVEDWYEHVLRQKNNRPKVIATFYHFVLCCLYGFGTFRQLGNVELLRKANILKGNLLELSKHLPVSEHRVEWLGPPVPTIDRLIPGRYCFEDQDKLLVDGNDFERLEIRTGTICPPNNITSKGIINLDLGQENRETVKIHFVPHKWNMKGKRFKGKRVQFVICFNYLYMDMRPSM